MQTSKQTQEPKKELSSPAEPFGSKLLDLVSEKLKVRTDVALCRILEADTATVSRIRKGRDRVSASLLISMHEKTGLSIAELKGILRGESIPS